MSNKKIRNNEKSINFKKKTFLFERLVLLSSNVILSRSLLKVFLKCDSLLCRSAGSLGKYWVFVLEFGFDLEPNRYVHSFPLNLCCWLKCKMICKFVLPKNKSFLSISFFFHYFPRNNEVLKTLNQCKALLYLVYRYQLQTL